MAPRSTLRRGAIAAAVLALLHSAAFAQGNGTTVTVTGRSDPVIGVGGFGAPLSTSPLHAAAYSAAQLRELGIDGLSQLTMLEAALGDAYNSPGYWSQLTARGYVLDNRGNYRRDGLPINAETALSLVNKERVEVLYGANGIQAGTSAPGGLVNLVVKRPTGTVRDAGIEVSERGTTAMTIDLSQRFGVDHRFGARLNVGAATLRPHLRDARGHNRLVALALDWQLHADSRLEFELESSHQSQPSVPGFSLLGDRLPDARSIDPRINLNNQPWSLPVVLDGDTASLRWRQRLAADWSATVHGQTQRLRSDDRVAFPFGCYDAAADVYHADRYCPDGSFDLYDFRSEGERRRVDAVDAHVDGLLHTGRIAHRLTAGMLWSHARDRFGRQAYNYSGSGHVDGSVVLPPAPELTEENTNRDHRSRELYVRDMMTLTPQWQLWLGLRHSTLDRRSVRTDGSRPTDYRQSFTTPWVAVSFRPSAAATWYLSWGQGVESDVVPNRGEYLNRGEALPALKSRQWEAGVKLGTPEQSLALAVFDIRRPMADDFCDDGGENCVRRTDGVARHRGIDASGQWRNGRWSTRLALQWLDAQREGSVVDASNGRRPTNVPRHAVRAQLGYEPTPAVALRALLSHEGRRAVLPDNRIELPSWTRFDLAAEWRTSAPWGGDTRLRVGVDNVADRRAWQESPYQFGHVYLYPMQPRTWRVAMQTSF